MKLLIEIVVFQDTNNSIENSIENNIQTIIFKYRSKLLLKWAISTIFKKTVYRNIFVFHLKYYYPASP